jgi:hypothetical protein
VVVAVAVAILMAVVSILLANRILSSAGKEHNSAVSPFITVVGLVYGALLGFTVVVSWQQFSSAGAVVADEASTLTTMYGQTVAMPEQEQTQLRQLLRQYAAAVTGREWDKEASGGTGDGGRNAITGMYRVIGSQPPNVASSSINGAFLNQLSALASDRATRMIDAKPRIPAAVCGAHIRRDGTGDAHGLPAPWQHHRSHNGVQHDRGAARLTAVHRLLARPSFWE